MLKSLSTQFAATLFFGPLGLAYSSVAAAVFMTLLLAVLFFSVLGVLAIFVIWPVSILVGLIFVKLHNDEIRSSGSRLLLGPGDEYEEYSPVGSWGRGIAVLSLALAAAFIAYLYLPKGNNDIGKIVASSSAPTSGDRVGAEPQASDTVAMVVPVPNQSDPDLQTNTSVNVTPAVIAAKSNSDENNDFAVIALPEQEVATVIIDSDGNVQQGEVESALNSGRPELTVDAPLVNLRRGPGTGFDIITTVQAGDKLFEYARDGNWINVETASNGFSGWIYSRLVR